MAETDTTDKTVLAPYYLNASDDELDRAVDEIEIELMERRARAGKKA